MTVAARLRERMLTVLTDAGEALTYGQLVERLWPVGRNTVRVAAHELEKTGRAIRWIGADGRHAGVQLP